MEGIEEVPKVKPRLCPRQELLQIGGPRPAGNTTRSIDSALQVRYFCFFTMPKEEDKYEYQIMNLTTADQPTKQLLLNWEGEEHWRLITVITDHGGEQLFIFMRNKHESRTVTTDSL